MTGKIIILAILLAFPLCGAEWTTVSVPGEQTFEGYAWYRTWFKPHPTFFNRHDRDLYAESSILNIRSLAGAHEVYLNGKKIGTGGVFPPEFADGREGNHRHKIPPGTLVKDQWNELAVRVYNSGGPGGFLTEAPFIMNYYQELAFEGVWEFYSGDGDFLPGGALKSKPATTAFEEFYESNSVLGEAEKFVQGKKMSPANSFAKMKTADDLVVDLMLSEPLVAQPTHFSFDSRGRLWVAQYRQYPYPAGLKMISRDRYYRSHYDKVPPAPPNHDRGRDIISVHEDTDGDGTYDKHKVFQDGLNMANAAVRGRGGVWVMHTPYLLFYPDENFDDIPDGPPEVLLEGFGMEDNHSVANGLVWGMDGWLYGAQGSTTSCHVKRPGIDPPNAAGVYFQGCMVWRYHPETKRFEIFAQGGGNNFGLEVDAGGRIFTGNNGGGTRGWHYMQGGMHLMQHLTPNKFGPPRNPFAFGDLPKMESEQEIKRFTHFATMVESTALPEKYQGSFFGVDPLANFVIASKRLPVGATFRTTDIGKVLTSDDFAFRPVFIGNAPDGSVLVADFYEHYIAHGQHYQSQIDSTTGRIFRLRGKNEKLESDLDLHSKSTNELLALLRHPNKWHRHTAVRLLGERKDPAAVPALRKLVGTGEDLESLAALWAIYQIAGLDDETALTALGHSYPPVRYWSVRFICDDAGFANKRTTIGLIDSIGNLSNGPMRVSENLFAALLEQARLETNAEVRSQFAGSARRLPANQAMALVTAILSHDEDLEDRYVPLLCWWVLEANLDRNREAVLSLFNDRQFTQMPMVVTHILSRIMRALALKGRNRDLQDCVRLLAQATGMDQVDQLLEGFELAYAGRRMGGLPDELASALVESGRPSLEIRVRLGDKAAEQEAVKLLQTKEAATVERIAVARTLGEVRANGSLQALIEVSSNARHPDLQRAALAALSSFSDPAIGEQILGQFSKYQDTVLPAVFDLLLSRAQWTSQLAQQISMGNIPVEAISMDIADRLRRHPDDSIAAVAKEKFGAGVDLDSADAKLKVEILRDLLVEGTGNPYAGEITFIQRCAACHKLFHKGGNIGPDLTPYPRGNLETLLFSVINPNAEIREGFEYVTLQTTDGRTLNGFLTDQDTQVVALRGMAGEDIRVERMHVKSLEPIGRSLMPEGLLAGMSDQELRDFFAYLRISQPISN
jgi:putative heme-binding domain-containing protein